MNIDGSNPRLVSGDWDRSPADLQWAPDGSGLYFTAQSEGTQNLYFLALTGANTGKVQPVTEGVHMLTTSDINKNGKAVGVLTSFHKPDDIVIFDLKQPGQMKQLTNVNEDMLTGKKLGEVEEIWYTSPDGLKIQGWYITPPDFDPAQEVSDAAPHPRRAAQHVRRRASTSAGRNMAANDYVILYTNPRGSTGYGSEFGNAIKQRVSGQGLRRPDGRRRHDAREGLHRPRRTCSSPAAAAAAC